MTDELARLAEENRRLRAALKPFTEADEAGRRCASIFLTGFERAAEGVAAQLARARAAGRREALEEAAKVVAGRGPASQDMTSTMIREALDGAAAAIRALASQEKADA